MTAGRGPKGGAGRERERRQAPDGWPERGWADLLRWIEPRGRRWARRKYRLDEGKGADASQEAMTSLLLVTRAGEEVERPRAWLARVTHRRLGSEVRREIVRSAGPLLEEGLPAATGRPDEAALLQDLWKEAPKLLGRLPPPWREVALLQLVEQWSREEIIAWLRRWRPTRESYCRKVIAQAHGMVRCLGGDVSPKTRWPERYDAKKNAWLRYPPPPFIRHTT